MWQEVLRVNVRLAANEYKVWIDPKFRS